MESMFKAYVGLLLVMAVMAAVFAVLSHFWPSKRGQRVFFRKGFSTDLAYWGLGPLLNRAIMPVLIAVALIPVALALGVQLQDLKQGFGPLGALPLWQQALMIIILADLIGYWLHRFTHAGWWWKVHAVHHSSEQLDWLAAARVHPLNDIFTTIGQAVPLVAIGLSPLAVAGIAPLFTLYAIMLHANLNWSFGPLRYVIASPAFHRWHHTSAEEGRDKNFAGLFPLWDIVFGTFYMPRGRQADAFGAGPGVPQTFTAQLTYPFQKTD